jgi:mono/diheme cytochrome c family protein
VKTVARPPRATLFRDVLPAVRGALVLLAGLFVHGGLLADAELVEQGRYVFHAAGCVSCHRGDQTLAGGLPIVSPYGTFYPPNITPHRERGIGRWSEEDFIRALRMGISPRGQHYYPAFPYPSYTRMTQQDMRALYAYLKTWPESVRQSRAHEVPWPLSSRGLIGHWKQGRFTPGEAVVDPAKSPQWNRGAYLATALGHCSECHTPRGFLGTPRSDRYLAGTCSGPDELRVPNITPDEETGIGSWTAEELDTFLATGRRPDGCYASGLMMEVLGTSCMQLTDDDRRALAFYLASLPPIHNNLDYLCASFEDDVFLE